MTFRIFEFFTYFNIYYFKSRDFDVGFWSARGAKPALRFCIKMQIQKKMILLLWCLSPTRAYFTKKRFWYFKFIRTQSSYFWYCPSGCVKAPRRFWFWKFMVPLFFLHLSYLLLGIRKRHGFVMEKDSINKSSTFISNWYLLYNISYTFDFSKHLFVCVFLITILMTLWLGSPWVRLSGNRKLKSAWLVLVCCGSAARQFVPFFICNCGIKSSTFLVMTTFLFKSFKSFVRYEFCQVKCSCLSAATCLVFQFAKPI